MYGLMPEDRGKALKNLSGTLGNGVYAPTLLELKNMVLEHCFVFMEDT